MRSNRTLLWFNLRILRTRKNIANFLFYAPMDTPWEELFKSRIYLNDQKYFNNSSNKDSYRKRF